MRYFCFSIEKLGEFNFQKINSKELGEFLGNKTIFSLSEEHTTEKKIVSSMISVTIRASSMISAFFS